MSAHLSARSTASLLGLALGGSFGSQFFVPANQHALSSRLLPPGPWQWTDDTEMACSIYRVLADHGAIDQDELAASFAARHDFDRGYGPATNRMLRLVREGGDWRTLSAMLGNGRQVAAHDTVPFTLWVAARERRDFETAMWTTAAAGGDVDTTCAIVGGIIAAAESTQLPPQWRERCEPLPDWSGAPHESTH
ncbi:ADP-ribosylglycohydrolase family protein [Nonomuraea aurantiaca]|uniref:ADP-ribosylglycohydrolase family protein n=1 Tax=Nonomuraea aurantiaca TaxID=2878562 RepID=UPI001CD91FD7|nr:ADP-ribosylglycohydrolase family protein [Nonomuraea aurantiaca]MCA2223354.1 ADP-ribosylglycohydrolase family protein [Nonomuraea aurantiaca]